MIKCKKGLAKFVQWYKCIILDKHNYIKLPLPLGYSDKLPVEIYKCKYCGRTRCDYEGKQCSDPE